MPLSLRASRGKELSGAGAGARAKAEEEQEQEEQEEPPGGGPCSQEEVQSRSSSPPGRLVHGALPAGAPGPGVRCQVPGDGW